MGRTAVSPTGDRLPVRRRPAGTAATVGVARTVGGRTRGARNRSRIDCERSSPMMGRCGSRTRRSTRPCSFRAVVRSPAVIRGAVAALVLGGQSADLDAQPGAAGVLPRGITVAPRVEPGRADPSARQAGRMRDSGLVPLGGDEGRHGYRAIASVTQRATERSRTSRCIAAHPRHPAAPGRSGDRRCLAEGGQPSAAGSRRAAVGGLRQTLVEVPVLRVDALMVDCR